MPSKLWLIIIGGALAVLIGMPYLLLVNTSEDVNGAWGMVEVTYQRRADLIPQLVETVKGMKNFEQSTLEAVTKARQQVTQLKVGEGSVQQFMQAQAELGGALSRLLVTVEKYPDLKSDVHFQGLMHELAGTENRIAVARKRFQDAVQMHNRRLRKMPWMKMFFDKAAYYQADAGASVAPKVSFE